MKSAYLEIDTLCARPGAIRGLVLRAGVPAEADVVLRVRAQTSRGVQVYLRLIQIRGSLQISFH